MKNIAIINYKRNNNPFQAELPAFLINKEKDKFDFINKLFMFNKYKDLFISARIHTSFMEYTFTDSFNYI